MKVIKKILPLILMFSLCMMIPVCGGAAQESEQDGSEEKVIPPDSADTTADVLVVFFSATGTTKGVAEKIAALENADTYEIIAAQEYSEDDLDYNDPDSRTTIEQDNPDCRPEISGELPDLSGYSKIYIGYPIWWGQAPRILDTFVESCDFESKIIIPFCTSGSSGIGKSSLNLEKNAGSGDWMQGERFSGNVSDEDLQEWIDGFPSGASEEDAMIMMINDTKVNVKWEDNDSVKELMELAGSGITISMSMYGGFEQVGSIGKDITRNDEQTTTEPGDIVLYSGNQLVVFYGSNSWAYTRLGKIDLSETELNELLGNGDVTIKLGMENEG